MEEYKSMKEELEDIFSKTPPIDEFNPKLAGELEDLMIKDFVAFANEQMLEYCKKYDPTHVALAQSTTFVKLGERGSQIIKKHIVMLGIHLMTKSLRKG